VSTPLLTRRMMSGATTTQTSLHHSILDFGTKVSWAPSPLIFSMNPYGGLFSYVNLYHGESYFILQVIHFSTYPFIMLILSSPGDLRGLKR
jgi:hypothetical protein